MQETRQLSPQEAHDFLNSRITTLEEAVLAQKHRSDVHTAFLAALVITIQNPEKLLKIWQNFSYDYEDKTIANYGASLDKTREEKFRADIRDALQSWSEVVEEAIKLRQPQEGQSN
ncbi:TPA: hypothetical protein ACKPVS_001303 [Serratia marcescens]|uniref:hypothetical protein n=1 Tax=Serratia sarumanii TaxID=3020826 RepID=UPI0030951F82|nr:hypothetical protein [Serratia marcescens]